MHFRIDKYEELSKAERILNESVTAGWESRRCMFWKLHVYRDALVSQQKGNIEWKGATHNRSVHLTKSTTKLNLNVPAHVF